SALFDELPGKLRPHALEFSPVNLGTVPRGLPANLVNPVTGRVFNELWFHKAPRYRAGEIQHASSFFHPLDVVGRWNRLYGPRGFCQYQLVMPFGAERAVHDVVATVAAS